MPFCRKYNSLRPVIAPRCTPLHLIAHHCKLGEVLTVINIAELVADLLYITNGCLLVVLNILVLFEDLEHAIESLTHCTFAVLRVEVDSLVPNDTITLYSVVKIPIYIIMYIR